jgi:hypothetical protein
MNKHYQKAAQRLHNFAAEDNDASEMELRAELESQGVDVEAFLSRLASESGIEGKQPAGKRLATGERLRKLASKANSKLTSLLEGLNADDQPGLASPAFGRSGRTAKKSDGQKKRDNNSKK